MSNVFRVAKINDNDVYVIVAHPVYGAIAFRFQRNVGGTDPADLSGTYEVWRRTADYMLPSVESDPLGPRTIIASDIGASDYAFYNVVVGKWGGSYHGGEVLLSSTGPTLAESGWLSDFSMTQVSRITYAPGISIDITRTFTLGPDGTITETVTAVSDDRFSKRYIGMEIGSGTGWTQVSTDGGVHYQNLGSVMDYDAGRVGDAIMRNAVTGQTIVVSSDAVLDPSFAGIHLIRNGARTKLYYDLDSGVINTMTVSRTVAFGLTPAGTPIHVTSMESYTLAALDTHLTLLGTQAINGFGNAQANIITGNDAANWLTGGGGNDVLRGGGGNDRIEGGEGNDFLESGSGTDLLDGGDGDDGFYFGAEFDASDRVIGGAGDDQIGLQGDYAAALILGDQAMIGVETVALLSSTDTRFGGEAATPFSYHVVAADGNVAAGALLTINGNGLQVGENLTWDASAETDGSIRVFGGFGTETLTGGAQDDGFFFGEGRYDGAADKVNGGVSTIVSDNQMALRGSFSGTLAEDAITSIQTIALISARDPDYAPEAGPFSYALTLSDGNVAAGARLTITGNGLSADEVMIIDGSAESDGRLRLIGGAGGDSLTGGAGDDELFGGLGADLLAGGGGSDRFVYTDVLQSTAGEMDVITGFGAGDIIDLSRIDADSGAPGHQGFTFIGSAAFSGAAGEVRIVESAGETWVEATTGAGPALFIKLVTDPGFVITDASFAGLAA